MSGLRFSDAFAQLATALASAQGQFANPLKDKTAKVRMKNGGEYSFNYADLASVFDAIRQPLAANQLALVQGPQIEYLDREGGGIALVTVTTRLIHSSGEWIECDTVMGADEQRPQVVSSAITYAKRYGLQALLGVVADEDDDGNAATGNTASIASRERKEAPKQAAPKAQGGPITPAMTAADKAMQTGKTSTVAAPVTTTAKPAPQRYEEACDQICRKLGTVPGNKLIVDIRAKHGAAQATTDQKMFILAELEEAAKGTP